MILSHRTLRIVKVFVSTPDHPIYCYAIARQCHINTQTVRPLLRMLADEGWLERIGIVASTCNRPEKLLYRATERGIREGYSALAELQLSSTVTNEQQTSL